MTVITQTADLKSQLRSKEFPNDVLYPFRKKALGQLEENGFPTQKHEEWKYMNLKPVVNGAFSSVHTPFSKKDFQKLPYSTLEGIHLVMVDGKLVPGFSGTEEGLTILPLVQGASQFPELFEGHFDNAREQEDNAFRQMNTAYSEEGVFIYAPYNKVIEKTVFLHHLYTCPSLSLVRNFVWLGEGSGVTLVETVNGTPSGPSFSNHTSEIFLGPRACLAHYCMRTGNRAGYHIGMNFYHQKESSVLHALTVTTQGAIVRNNVQAILDGSHIESNLHGLYITNGDSLVDNHTLVDHRSPNSNSNELYKGLMDGKSTGVFNGKIFVRQDAQKTNAFQSNKNILLSSDASINTKPQLEIFADDVKCSHGCTTGQLDEESMFYLRSRGIGAKEAKALLVKAYAFDVLSVVKDVAIKALIERQIDEKLVE